MKLFWKLFLSVFISFFIVSSLIFYIIIVKQIGLTEAGIIEQNTLVGSFMKKEIEKYAREAKWPWESLNKLSQSHNFLFWWILDEDGKISLGDNAAFMGTFYYDYFPDIFLVKEKENIIINHKKDFVIYSQPFSLPNKTHYFWFGFSTQDITKMKNEIISSFCFFFLLSLIVLALVLYGIVYFFIRPINELAKGSEEIGKGILNYRIKNLSKDELGQLSMHFNKMAENLKQITVSKEYMNSIINNMSDILIIIDKHQKIKMVNKTVTALLGYSSNEIQGKEIGRIIVSANDNSLSLNELTGSQLIKNRDVIFKTKDKGEIITNFSTSHFKNVLTNKNDIICIAQDISERKKIESDRLRLDKLESLGLLAGGIAHDFNNMLGTIYGHLDLARNFSGANEKVKKNLNMACMAFEKAKNLTQQLLTFSKGGMPVKEKSDIKSVIIESGDFVLSGSNVNCHYTLDKNLHLVEMDIGQITQVISNIVINARQAMPDGGTIEIMADNYRVEDNNFQQFTQKNYIRIRIKDRGIGIPEKNLAKIFDPFFSTKKQGSGLGLTTCFSIVKNHNGHIHVESKLDNGTCFTLFLPSLTESENVQKENTLQDTTPKDFKLNILIMDDDELMLGTAIDMIELLGHSVGGAKNGEEIIQQYKNAWDTEEKIDLVILDLTIQDGMGGRLALQELKKINPHIISIVSSGYSNDPVLANPSEYGFTGVLRKPYMLKELTAVLTKMISKIGTYT